MDTAVLGDRMVSRALVSLGDTGKQTYIAGPMRGYKDSNFPAFYDAAEKLIEKGFRVFNPAEYDEKMGFDPVTETWAAGKEMSIRQCIQLDLSWITEYADLVVVLPGWKRSRGALAEVYTAKAIGVPVYELGDVLNGNMRKVIL